MDAHHRPISWVQRLPAFVAFLGVLALLVVAASYRQPDPPVDPKAARARLNGRLAVGIDPSYPPFAVIDGKGELKGFDVDFAVELAKRLGAKADFVGLDVGAIFDGLTQRRFDVIISGIPPYPEYSRDIIYSQPYFNAGQVLLVKAGTAGPAAAQDLKGVVAVEIGSTGEVEARRLASRQPELQVLVRDTPAHVAEAVRGGTAGAGMLDRLTAVELLKTEQGIQLAGPPITLEPYVVAARKADAGLMVEIDAAIRAMQQDGFLANLERRWLGPGATGLNPVDGERAAASP